MPFLNMISLFVIINFRSQKFIPRVQLTLGSSSIHEIRFHYSKNRHNVSIIFLLLFIIQ